MSKANKDHLAMVAEFMKAMEQPVAQGWEDESGLLLGLNLIKEEYRELNIEVEHLLSQFLETDEEAEVREHFTKELADLLYVCYWTAARIGVDVNEAFRRVHASNMSKLDPATGKALKRADGKVLKGPNYHVPVLMDVVKNVPVTL